MTGYDIRESDVFVIVDVQRDFCAGGALEVPDGDAVVPAVNRLAERFPHTILTQDWHPAGHQSFASSHSGKAPFDVIEMGYGAQVLWPDHCVQGTVGAAFHADLSVQRAEMIVRKGFNPLVDSYSAFFENDKKTSTGLGGYLRERGFTRVFLAGLAFDFCVRYSAEDAKAQGFEAIVLDDACRAIDMDGSADATRARFAELGVVTALSTTLA